MDQAVQMRAETRWFTMADQERFAAASGDYNPMHMDRLAARRTPAGGCVVHGVHGMLWALEDLGGILPLDELCGIDADFGNFLYVDEEATVHLRKLTKRDARVELYAGESRVAQYGLKFGARAGDEAAPAGDGDGGIFYANDAVAPLALSWAEVADAHGRLAPFAGQAGAASMFPRLTQAIGAHRIASILQLTRLVGMVSPGLHSTFHRINIRLVDETGVAGPLEFTTRVSEPRFAVATMEVRGPGVVGSIKASRRQPPCAQPDFVSLQQYVRPARFAGHAALVVGGSRGLGEVTAKLLAAGGAEVVITYAAGATDADAVVREIKAGGGKASAMAFDVTRPAVAQLAALPDPPTSLYYFATPRITTRPSSGISTELLARFTKVYVEAFNELCVALLAGRREPLWVFYPSTIFVDEPAKNLAEYAMAKAAGEVLASYMTRHLPLLNVEIARLPRLATDQTASMVEQAMGLVVETMLPLIERVEDQAAGAGA